MFLHVIVFLMAVLTQSQGQGYRVSNVGYSRSAPIPSRCTSLNKPCRIKVNMMSNTGAVVHQSEAYTCSCNLPLQCPTNWMDSMHAVTRTLITENSGNMTFSIMFCAEIAPKEICNAGQASLELSGYLNIPNDLESYNCRCGDGQPLQLRQRRIHNFRYYHNYVCNSDKPTCTARGRCMTITPQVTTYQCKCPTGSVCRTDGQWTAFTQRMHGHCRPQTLGGTA